MFVGHTMRRTGLENILTTRKINIKQRSTRSPKKNMIGSHMLWRARKSLSELMEGIVYEDLC